MSLNDDELFEEAKEIVITTKIASISLIQRKLRIGYNKAFRLMEELEKAGVVSVPDEFGKREVLNNE